MFKKEQVSHQSSYLRHDYNAVKVQNSEKIKLFKPILINNKLKRSSSVGKVPSVTTTGFNSSGAQNTKHFANNIKTARQSSRQAGRPNDDKPLSLNRKMSVHQYDKVDIHEGFVTLCNNIANNNKQRCEHLPVVNVEQHLFHSDDVTQSFLLTLESCDIFSQVGDFIEDDEADRKVTNDILKLLKNKRTHPQRSISQPKLNFTSRAPDRVDLKMEQSRILRQTTQQRITSKKESKQELCKLSVEFLQTNKARFVKLGKEEQMSDVIHNYEKQPNGLIMDELVQDPFYANNIYEQELREKIKRNGQNMPMTYTQSSKGFTTLSNYKHQWQTNGNLNNKLIKQQEGQNMSQKPTWANRDLSMYAKSRKELPKEKITREGFITQPDKIQTLVTSNTDNSYIATHMRATIRPEKEIQPQNCNGKTRSTSNTRPASRANFSRVPKQIDPHTVVNGNQLLIRSTQSDRLFPNVKVTDNKN